MNQIEVRNNKGQTALDLARQKSPIAIREAIIFTLEEAEHRLQQERNNNNNNSTIVIEEVQPTALASFLHRSEIQWPIVIVVLALIYSSLFS